VVVRGWDPLDPEVVAATVIDGMGQATLRFRVTHSAVIHRLSGVTVTGGDPGIDCRKASPEIDRCRITGNYSPSGGRGIVCHGGAPIITNCTITANGSSDPGGGLYCFKSSPTVVDCTISGNFAEYKGAGLYCYRFSPTLTRCTIAENSTLMTGAGIYCWEGSPLFTRCTIAGNVALEEGGGLYCLDSSPTLVDCILWNDSPREIYPEDADSAIVTYSDVQGGWDGEGNIDTDPRFCAEGCAGSESFGLASDSPCLGSGQGGADMGAWGESCVSPAQSVPTVLEVPGDYPTLRAALDSACRADTILVAPGTYQEPGLTILGRGLVLRGWDPLDPRVVAATVIEGDQKDVMFFRPPVASMDATLAGVTVTGGGTGIRCDGASPRIEHCVITGNSTQRRGVGLHCNFSSPTLAYCSITDNEASDYSGGGIYGYQSSPIVRNCVMARNYSYSGSALYCSHGSSTLRNCTIMENSGNSSVYGYSSDLTITNCILWNDTSREIHYSFDAPVVTYSDVRGYWSGEGNIDADPGFRGVGSFEGLLGPGSPCIDGGDPAVEDAIFDWHPRWPDQYPNGPRSDMGAYGGEGNSGWVGGGR